MIRFVFGADTTDFDKKTGSMKSQLKQLGEEARASEEKLAKGLAVGATIAAVAFGKLISSSMDAVRKQQEMITAADGAQKQLLLAAQAAQKYGNNLSQMDLNSVMNASLAIEDMTDMATGFGKQLTANMSPAIQGVAKALSNATDEAGGMGSMADKAFQYIVDGSAFAVSAADGVGRAFTMTSDAIIAGFAAVASGIADTFSSLLNLANAVPGVELDGVIESVDRFASEMASVATSAVDHIATVAEKELAGETLKGWIKEAEATADYTRNLTKEEKQILGEKEIARQEAMKKEAEDEKKRKDDYIKNLNSRVDAIRESNKTERELLDDKYAEEIEIIKEAYANKQLAADEAASISRDSADKHNKAILEMERQVADEAERIHREREQAKVKAVSDTFSNLSTLMNSGSKKMFDIGKAAALANTAMSTAQAAMASYASVGGGPLGAIAAASAIAAGLVQMQNIRKQSFNGGGGGLATGGSVTQNINSGSVPVINRNITVDVSGETVSQNSRDTIRALIGSLNENIGDNVTLGVR